MNKYPDYKECLVHGVEMPLRMSKFKRTRYSGDHYYSHGKEYNGKTVWCKGYGFKNPDVLGPRYLPEL